MIQLYNFFGNPNVGVYAFTNDKVCFIPKRISNQYKEIISEILNVPVYKIDVSSSRIIGIFITGNSYGLLLPEIIEDHEIALIEKVIEDLELDIKIEVLPAKLNALGNNILVNDHAAIINIDYDEHFIEIIKDVLLVDEIMQKTIANSKLVGSNALVTNKGLLVNPLATVEELEFLEDFFKVPSDIGTVNQGVGVVKSGLIANTYGAIIARNTTGPELQRISSILDI